MHRILVFIVTTNVSSSLLGAWQSI